MTRVGLALAVLLLARGAGAQTTTTTTLVGIGKAPVVQELSGAHKVPNGATYYEGVRCNRLDRARPGYLTQCTDCVEGSDPAACGGTGCLVEYQNGRWRCLGATSGGGGNACSTACTPDPCIGQDLICVPVCPSGHLCLSAQPG